MRNTVLLGVLALCSLAGCGTQKQSETAPDEKQPETPRAATGFRNANLQTDFAGDAACFDCHEEQYRGYQEHGMARSYYEIDALTDTADLPVSPPLQSENGLTYRVAKRGTTWYQEEFRLDADGDTTHYLRRAMQDVVGSGTAAHTFLTENKGRLYELPITWYAQEKKWDFSPGYAVNNSRFNRLIPDRCMACHNSYPESVPHAEGKYKNVPSGIGCERCHGPGELHVEARLASPEPAGEVDSTIVNPAHLDLDRRLDVCQQCHLHGTVSTLREGRGPFGFRPSEPLEDYVALFSVKNEGGGDQISVISQADRMKQSACFEGTRAAAGMETMDCVTCHDPHEGFRDQGPSYFNETCKECHALDDLQQSLPQEAREIHTASANCIDCHMPKVQAEDAPHASFTDHNIRVVEEQAETKPLSQRTADELKAYFERDRSGPDARRYRGMAYVKYARRKGDDRGAFRRGVKLLQQGLSADSSHADAQFLLGYGYRQLGQIGQAIPPLEEAVRLKPDSPDYLNALAQSYEAGGRSAQKTERLYQHALQIQPAAADVRVNYGRFLQAEGRVKEAARQYRKAAKEQPWLATTHYNLGTAYLQQGSVRKGVDALKRAVELRPGYAQALGNLGAVYAQRGFPERARSYFEQALEAAPESAVALGNLGSFYLNRGERERAVELLRRAVEADSQYVDGTESLALAYFRDEQYERARRYARRTLELAPNNERARQIMRALP
jgi:tetratricopeptide (TPR) repeat protein